MPKEIAMIKHLSYEEALAAFADRAELVGAESEDPELCALKERIADLLIEEGAAPIEQKL
jgi:hypothetical protein